MLPKTQKGLLLIPLTQEAVDRYANLADQGLYVDNAADTCWKAEAEEKKTSDTN